MISFVLVNHGDQASIYIKSFISPCSVTFKAHIPQAYMWTSIATPEESRQNGKNNIVKTAILCGRQTQPVLFASLPRTIHFGMPILAMNQPPFKQKSLKKGL
jgi:hypothetical protein